MKTFIVYFKGKKQVESDSRKGAKLLLGAQMKNIGVDVTITMARRIKEGSEG